MEGVCCGPSLTEQKDVSSLYLLACPQASLINARKRCRGKNSLRNWETHTYCEIQQSRARRTIAQPATSQPPELSFVPAWRQTSTRFRTPRTMVSRATKPASNRCHILAGKNTAPNESMVGNSTTTNGRCVLWQLRGQRGAIGGTLTVPS